MHPECFVRLLARSERNPAAQPACARCPGCGERPAAAVYCGYDPWHRDCLEREAVRLDAVDERHEHPTQHRNWPLHAATIRAALRGPPGLVPVWSPNVAAGDEPYRRFVLERYDCTEHEAELVVREVVGWDMDASWHAVLYVTRKGEFVVPPHRGPELDMFASELGVSPRE